MANRFEAFKKEPSLKGLIAWVVYDWANSSYFAVIQTFIFAAYFTKAIAADVETGTAQWANMISLSAIVIAISSPLFGAMADQAGRRKPWLAVFTAICVVASALLWYATPGTDSISYSLYLVFISTVAVEVAYVFYNAMLPDLVGPARMGRLSGWGWGMGYLGGLVCLILALVVFIQNDGQWFGLDTSTSEPVRATFVMAAIWFAVFALPLFIWTKDTPSTNKKIMQSVRDGYMQIKLSIQNASKLKNIGRFLIARVFFNDAIVTIFALGGVYAAGTFDMDESDILYFGIGLNITAGIGAFGLAWMDDKLGSKFTINLSIIGLLIPVIALLLVDSMVWFVSLGLILGIFVGPIQSASRTFIGRTTPPELNNQMFGLLALSGKVTSFIGPFLVGYFTLKSGSQRVGMVIIPVLLVIGFVLMLTVKEEKVQELEIMENL